jgi:hypothetical protein
MVYFYKISRFRGDVPLYFEGLDTSGVFIFT